jgi:glucan phosphoethanolaminetransferase (alkaline phosphatase superfamily)
MLQRIQSLYLLLAALCVLCMLFFPVATFNVETNHGTIHFETGMSGMKKEITGTRYKVDKEYMESVIDTKNESKYSKFFNMGMIGVLVFFGLIIFVIFLYKKLDLQISMTTVLLGISVAFLLAVLFMPSLGQKFISEEAGFFNEIKIKGTSVSRGLSTWLPAGTIAFTLLALLKMKRDRRLLKSLDRLR